MQCIGLYRLRDFWDPSENHWRNFQRHRSELSTLVFPAFWASILFWLQHFLYLLLFLQHSCVWVYLINEWLYNTTHLWGTNVFAFPSGEWKTGEWWNGLLEATWKCGRSGLKISHVTVHSSSPSLHTLWAQKSEIIISTICLTCKKTPPNLKKVNDMLFISSLFCKKKKKSAQAISDQFLIVLFLGKLFNILFSTFLHQNIKAVLLCSIVFLILVFAKPFLPRNTNEYNSFQSFC